MQKIKCFFFNKEIKDETEKYKHRDKQKIVFKGK
jgi:hypothetical protein